MISIPNPCGAPEIAAVALPESHGVRRCISFSGDRNAAGTHRLRLLASLALIITSPLLAQHGRARVAVIDAAGAPIPDAVVELGDLRVMADRTGNAVFASLPARRLPVRVRAEGFKRWTGSLGITNHQEAHIEARLAVDTFSGEPPIDLAGEIRITVLDPSGAMVAQGEATARCRGGSTQKHRLSGAPVLFSGLPVGLCEVTVSAPGFRTWDGQATVGEGKSQSLTARLQLAPVGERVSVTPGNPLTRFKNWLTSCTRR